MGDTAIYRISHLAPSIPGGELHATLELCQNHLVSRLASGWSILGKSEALPGGVCRDCTNGLPKEDDRG